MTSTIRISDLVNELSPDELGLALNPAPVTPERVTAILRRRGVPVPSPRPGRRLTRLGLRLAIAAALALALSVTAYAVYQAHVADYALPAPTAAADIPDWDRLSLVGYQGTPEYEAYAAWTDWLSAWQEEHPDPWRALGVDDSYYETPDNYALIYSASFQDQADALDAIAEKYGLTLHKATAVLQRWEPETLYDILGTAPFLPEDFQGSGYIYDDGAFKVEGMLGDDRLAVSLFVSAKGSFSMISASFPSEYEEWTYQTASGQTVDLALSGQGLGIVLLETEGAYIQAKQALFADEGAPDMTRQALEAFADSIRLDVLAERFDGTVRPDTAKAVTERFDEDLAAQRQALEQAGTDQPKESTDADGPVLPWADREEQDAYILDKLGDWEYADCPEDYVKQNTSTFYLDGASAENASVSWTGDPAYSEGVVHVYWSESALDTLYLRYERFYTSARRDESDCARQFAGLKERWYPDGAACAVGGWDAWYVPRLSDGPHSGLYWLDTDRDLIFSLDCGGLASQETLTALADALTASLS